MDFEQARYNMIEQQIRPWDVLDQRVLDTLAGIPRDRYVPDEYRSLAYSDTRIPIGHGEVMMNPNVEGRMLQLLQIAPGDRVLEVGTGSGYMTACLSALGESVESVEIHADLSREAAQRLQRDAVRDVTLQVGDAAAGWGDARAYDVIAITGSLTVLPDHYREALRNGGRLFAVCGSLDEPIMQAMLVTRVSDDNWTVESIFETELAPLANSTPVPEFVF
jgi:protein-L-isoaspartate(D-aspartate) O-methyltransferase